MAEAVVVVFVCIGVLKMRRPEGQRVVVSPDPLSGRNWL
jgi:hypothetical protein